MLFGNNWSDIMIKKLNNKGYLLVEIIVSFVIAMGVAFFLAEITINLKERQQDLDKEIQYNVDKSLMTKEIMDDVSEYGVKNVVINTKDENTIDCKITLSNGTEKNLNITKTGFTYGPYTKNFDSSLEVTLDNTNTKIDTTNKLLIIKVNAASIYSNKDYGLNLVIPYTG